MRLEARSRGCFSSTFLLELDGHPHGEFKGRWFSESVDVATTGRRRLHLDKIGWLGSRFVLTDTAGGGTLGEARREGWLSRAWSLELGAGPARLVSAGIFNTAYHVVQQGRTVGRANRVGLCQRGWFVEADPSLAETDLLLVGLIYHTILERHRRSD